MLLNYGVGEDSWESFGHKWDQTSQSWKKLILNIHWKDWCWSQRSNTLATWCKEPTYCRRPWCWKRLKAGGEGDDNGWDCWMASPTRWTWVEQTPGDRGGQRNLECCSPWGHVKLEVTCQLNNNTIQNIIFKSLKSHHCPKLLCITYSIQYQISSLTI